MADRIRIAVGSDSEGLVTIEVGEGHFDHFKLSLGVDTARWLVRELNKHIPAEAPPEKRSNG